LCTHCVPGSAASDHRTHVFSIKGVIVFMCYIFVSPHLDNIGVVSCHLMDPLDDGDGFLPGADSMRDAAQDDIFALDEGLCTPLHHTVLRLSP